MEQTWRWYGPNDPVSLDDIRQAGATGIVNALHHIPNGEVWSKEEILERKAIIEDKGLTWSVVESVPVHEEIKTQSGNFQLWIDNYKQTLRNLAECGIDTVCYNFMPVLDWTAPTLSMNSLMAQKLCALIKSLLRRFELYILKRPGAEEEYSSEDRLQAREYFSNMSESDIQKLTNNIIAGLPGAEEGYSLEEFQAQLDRYTGIDKNKLREHLAYFLSQLMPVCEAHGLKMAVHPDDPPRAILGLPRIVSTIEDINWLTENVPSKMNGLTMCTGSYGVRGDNDLVEMIKSMETASTLHTCAQPCARRVTQ